MDSGLLIYFENVFIRLWSLDSTVVLVKGNQTFMKRRKENF